MNLDATWTTYWANVENALVQQHDTLLRAPIVNPEAILVRGPVAAVMAPVRRIVWDSTKRRKWS